MNLCLDDELLALAGLMDVDIGKGMPHIHEQTNAVVRPLPRPHR